jgi:protein gp37
MWARRNPRFRGHWGKDAPRYFFNDEHWKQPLIWNAKCDDLGVRKRVLASLSDPFEELPFGHPDRGEMAAARLRLWHLIINTPRLDWLILTKRPENLRRMLPQPIGPRTGRLQRNLWLGVSAWDQPSADRNISLLLEVPAAVHWVSLEPLLGPVQMRAEWLAKLGWVVVGCESRGARPGRRCELTWVHDIGNACDHAGVPCFVKQLPDDERPGRLIKSAELAEHGWPVQMPRRSS